MASVGGVGGGSVVDGGGRGYYGSLAEVYDAYRPRPPRSWVGLLLCLARLDRPGLVVDLGSGTGLSTELWAGCAQRVVGVEPDERMRVVAESRAPAGVSYIGAVGEATGLSDSCADLVTACCSLNWMNEGLALVEIARILKPGGVFAACDVASRSIEPEVDRALDAVEEPIGAMSQFRAFAERRASEVEASGLFRFVADLTLVGEEEGGADRVVGLVLSHGQVARRLASGEWTEKGLGLHKLRRVARKQLGDRVVPFVFTYRACVAIRW